MERVRRIELLASDWKAEVLPLYDTRICNYYIIVLAILSTEYGEIFILITLNTVIGNISHEKTY